MLLPGIPCPLTEIWCRMTLLQQEQSVIETYRTNCKYQGTPLQVLSDAGELESPKISQKEGCHAIHSYNARRTKLSNCALGQRELEGCQSELCKPTKVAIHVKGVVSNILARDRPQVGEVNCSDQMHEVVQHLAFPASIETPQSYEGNDQYNRFVRVGLGILGDSTIIMCTMSSMVALFCNTWVPNKPNNVAFVGNFPGPGRLTGARTSSESELDMLSKVNDPYQIQHDRSSMHM
ncbi:hypothetical protein EDD16DRAFT_1523300 [Pisolithus croceorrhizus]|nr:hypothetical protein EDD16DRAFT_1523300 [Pisolithus croceorrhizus]